MKFDFSIENIVNKVEESFSNKTFAAAAPYEVHEGECSYFYGDGCTKCVVGLLFPEKLASTLKEYSLNNSSVKEVFSTLMELGVFEDSNYPAKAEVDLLSFLQFIHDRWLDGSTKIESYVWSGFFVGNHEIPDFILEAASNAGEHPKDIFMAVLNAMKDWVARKKELNEALSLPFEEPEKVNEVVEEKVMLKA